MSKIKNKLFLAILFCVLVVVFVGCTPQPQTEQLAKPTNLRLNGKVLTWSPVANASGYLVVIGDDEYEVTECKFDMSFIMEAGDYQIKVMALGDGETYSNSSFATNTVTLTGPSQTGTDEKGFKYTFVPERMGYEVSRGTANLINKVTIPDYFEGLPVVSIGNFSWAPQSAISPTSQFTEKDCNVVTTGLVLPKYLEIIPDKAFAFMVRLEEVVIPDTVTEIGQAAFYGCTYLTKVVLPKGLKIIPWACFQDTALKEITLPDGLEEIAIDAFRCQTVNQYHIDSELSSIVIPASVKKIAMKAFAGRENLKNVTFADSSNLEEFGRLVFDETAWYQELSDGLVCIDGVLYCYKGEMPVDTVLDIPDDVNCIAGGAFEYQKNLKKVTIPQGVILGEGAFWGCTSLEEVILPSDLKVIPSLVFSSTNNLKSISLPSTLVEIGETAFGNSGLEKISIPSLVKVIKTGAFTSCSSLKEVEMPEGLEVIENNAFQQCILLSKINLPKTLKTLGSNAFSGCSSLKDVVIPISLEMLGQTPFAFCNGLESIYYEGTQQQWTKLFAQNNAVNIGYPPLANATVYCYSETEPTDSGDYWHYDVDGKTPVIWTKED